MSADTTTLAYDPDLPVLLHAATADLSTQGPVATLTLHGEYDTFAAPLLAELAARWPLPGCNVLRVDLGDMGFIDSAGLRGIEALTRAVLRGGGTVRLTNPTPSATRLLALAQDRGWLPTAGVRIESSHPRALR